MDTFIWSDKYNVGFPDIDEQHKKFFSIINELLEFINTRQPDYVLNNSLKALADYSNYHFDLEEKYFNEFNYPEKEFHIREHNEFRNEVSKFYSDRSLSPDVYITAFKLGDYAQEWLKKHILDVDRKYVDFFKAHGVLTLLNSHQ